MKNYVKDILPVTLLVRAVSHVYKNCLRRREWREGSGREVENGGSKARECTEGKKRVRDE